MATNIHSPGSISLKRNEKKQKQSDFSSEEWYIYICVCQVYFGIFRTQFSSRKKVLLTKLQMRGQLVQLNKIRYKRDDLL